MKNRRHDAGILWLLLAGLLLPPAHAATLSQTLRDISSVPTRLPGTPGHTQIANYIEQRFRQAGLKNVARQEFQTTVPLEEEAWLTTPSGKIRIFCMWPNLVRTPAVPPEGVSAPLVYGGNGDLRLLNGKEIRGSIVVLEFSSGSIWTDLAMLGAKGFLFLETPEMTRTEAERKFLGIPLHIPRFYVPARDAGTVRALAEKNIVGTITARMVWRTVPDWNITGILQGTDTSRSDTVVIQAYYDSISVVPGIAPGADSACSIAALLDILDSFAASPPKRSVTFLATSSHFQGLKGAQAYVNTHYDPIKRSKTKEKITNTLVFGLELSSGSDDLAIWHNSYVFYDQRFFAPFGRKFLAYGQEAAAALGLPADTLSNGISPEKGVIWQTFTPDPIRTDGEVFVCAGVPALSFVTVNDGRWRVDTPADTFERLNLGNIERQVQFLTSVLRRACNDPALMEGTEAMQLKPYLSTLHVKVVYFNPKKNFVPSEPLPGALVAPQNSIVSGADTSGVLFKKSYTGVRNVIERTNASGVADISGFRWFNDNTCWLYAFQVDEDTGQIVKASDRGVNGNEQYPMSVAVDAIEKKWNVVVFPCTQVDIYGLVDPQYLVQLNRLDVLDTSNSLPDAYGFHLQFPDAIPWLWTSYWEPYGVVFAKPRTRIKVIGESGPLGKRVLLLNSKESLKDRSAVEGEGFPVDTTPAILETPYQSARDMIFLDRFRRHSFEQFGIRNERLKELQEESSSLLAQAQSAKESRAWHDFLRLSRQSQALESRAYPDVKSTANDVVKGIIFYFMLLLPFAYFLERLVFGFPQLERRIAGIFGIFLAIYWIMRLVHPAFRLTNAPEIILLGFIVLALSLIVLSIVASKFEEQMQRMKRESSKIYQTDVGRVTAAATAFSLGVANMKRRKVRTLLTSVTLILLTFTVLSFTSIKTYMRFNQIVRPYRPVYEGLLLRDQAWTPLQEIALTYAADEFGQSGVVCPRYWFIVRDIGSRTAVKVSSGTRSYLSEGIVGLSPDEPKITGVDRALVAGSWFAQDSEKSAIISSKIASALGITAADVGAASIEMYGATLRVRGIFDEKILAGITDLDDERLTPVDFSMLPETDRRKIVTERTAQVYTGKVRLQSFTHTEPANIVLVPSGLLAQMNGTLHSVAVRFGPGVNGKAVAESFVSKLAVIVYAGLGGKTIVYSSMGLTSLSGMANLFIPILIAAMIVLNTMLGSVFERLKEIGTYSAVGLAPVHIASLFLAESLVYAVLGAVAGYLLGQTLAFVLSVTGWLPGLILNYSSLSAVFATVIIVITVILSTLYPAKKASQMAVPDVTRRWVLPEPKEDVWSFEFPFTVSEFEVLGLVTFLNEYFNSYQDVSIGNFYTNGSHLRCEQLPTGKFRYFITTDTWLAPFDLGVSQSLEIRMEPLGQYDFYVIHLTMNRTSGESTDWKRMNRRFLDGIRKQFLVWRTVAATIKQEYEQQGRLMLNISQP